ncbi:MAG: tetratricopeptide repeat protein, partial [Elusimicrobia bacterium]|nr:tetratricopeptide repeat protein [Elusimicrobiota bacterium]
EAGTAAKPVFKESSVAAYQTYWYRVAVVAATGDAGPWSRPIDVFVPGSFNVAPVELSTAAVGNIFSANYKWYLKNPLGKAVLQNNLNVPFQNVKVSFRLKDFMDFATESVVEKLGPKDKVEVPLSATLNNRILEVSEDTPIQAEVTLTYYEKGQKRDFSLALPLRVYSRRAITWEDPRRIANFITPNDPPVDQLKSAVLRDPPTAPKGVELINPPVSIAARLWAAVSGSGVRFLPSPNNPFEQMSEDPAFPVDYTQFPRDTLARKSGECDDMVTLLSSLYENATVRTAMLDYPGHVALMFDTGSADPLETGLPQDLLVPYDGTLWVPLEATMVGQPFLEAVRKAAYAYKEMKSQDKASIIDPRQAWKVYEPATLPKPDAADMALDEGESKKRFESAASELLALRYKAGGEALEAKMAADGESATLWNQRGILEAQHGKPAEAEKAFKKALDLDGTSAAALNNLGNLAYEGGRAAEALARYKKAAAADPEDAGILMNMARAAKKLGQGDEARGFSERAAALDAGYKEEAAAFKTQ